MLLLLYNTTLLMVLEKKDFFTLCLLILSGCNATVKKSIYSVSQYCTSCTNSPTDSYWDSSSLKEADDIADAVDACASTITFVMSAFNVLNKIKIAAEKADLVAKAASKVAMEAMYTRSVSNHASRANQAAAAVESAQAAYNAFESTCSANLETNYAYYAYKAMNYSKYAAESAVKAAKAAKNATTKASEDTINQVYAYADDVDDAITIVLKTISDADACLMVNNSHISCIAVDAAVDATSKVDSACKNIRIDAGATAIVKVMSHFCEDIYNEIDRNNKINEQHVNECDHSSGRTQGA